MDREMGRERIREKIKLYSSTEFPVRVGYIHFKDHKRVRKDAMRRLKKLLKAFDTGEVELEDFDRSIESRFGHMKHADSYILIEETKEKVKEIKERKATA